MGLTESETKGEEEKKKNTFMEEWLQNLSDLLQQLIHQGNSALPHSNLN